MIVTIAKGDVSAAVDSHGAQLISMKKGDKEYIWQRDPKFWAGCAPILFPVVGRLRDGVLRIDGKDYPMPMHGFVRDMELAVTAQSESAVTFSLTDNEKTKEFYPWSFSFAVTFSMEGDKLTVSFAVENRDDKTMIFGLGGHPAFNVPMEDGAAFTDYQLVFEKEERLDTDICNMETIEIYGDEKKTVLDGGRTLPLVRSLFNGDALIFEDIISRSVDLVHKDTKKGIRFAYGDFPILAVWTRGEPQEAPYVCLEPWYSMGFRRGESTDINDKYGMQHLEPGKTFVAAFSAEILD